MACRRLWALIQGLPTDAATFRTATGWSHQDEMAARAVELIDQWGRLQLMYAARKPVRVPPPVVISRPKEPEPPKPNVITDPREISAWFAKNA